MQFIDRISFHYLPHEAPSASSLHCVNHIFHQTIILNAFSKIEFSIEFNISRRCYRGHDSCMSLRPKDLHRAASHVLQWPTYYSKEKWWNSFCVFLSLFAQSLTHSVWHEHAHTHSQIPPPHPHTHTPTRITPVLTVVMAGWQAVC